jgi:hypothetical protein
VERTNREVLRHLRAIIQDKLIESNWTQALPLMKRIINTTENEATVYSPAELLYGPAHNLDILALADDLPHLTDTDDALDWLRLQHETHEQAILLTKQRFRQELEERRKKAQKPTVFPVDSYVLVDHPTPIIPVGNEIKLRSYKKGPMRVTHQDGNTYTVRDLFTNREYDVNVTRLTEFLYDPDRIDPRIVALRDHNAFPVESILGVRTEGPKDTWQVKASWKGYGPQYDSWILWENAKNLELLHDYLRAHKLARLIPRSFKVKKRT